MADLKSWMARVPDDTSLSAMSIPGTHDTATYVCGQPGFSWESALIGGALNALPLINIGAARGIKFAQCQSLTITEQLEAGVRFLDLRLKDGTDFPLYHGAVRLGITLKDAMDDVDRFLKAHPTETVLVCVKKENDDDRDKTSAAVKAWFDKRPATRTNAQGQSEGIYMAARIPRLGEVRGRAVLINRIFETKDAGIFIWVDNNAIFDKTQTQGDGTNLRFAVQDHYDPDAGVFGSNLNEKKRKIQEAYERYAKSNYDLRIAFLTASSFPSRTPGEYADDINPRVFEFLRDWTDGQPWITVMDYVGTYGSDRTDPVAAIASANPLTKDGSAGARDTLKSGESLAPGEALLSSNQSYQAILQTDGNFCVRRTVDDCPTHASMTNGKTATRATMQDDGNFVIYDGDKALAWTRTDGKGKGRLVMQNDGNLVLYDNGGAAQWSSNFHPFHK